MLGLRRFRAQAVEVNRGTEVEDKACWMITGCGREPGGMRVAEAGCCPMAAELAVMRRQIPYPVCPLMEASSQQQIREAVHRLVEAAI